MNIKEFNKKLQIFTYRLLVRQASTEQKNQGAVMLFVISCGLIIVFLASIITLKSGDDSLASKIDTSNEQSKSITEAGVKHLLAEITDSSARGVLLLNQDPGSELGSDAPTQWQDGADISVYSGANSCFTESDEAVEAELTSFDTTGVVDVPMGVGNAAGKYTFKAYRYQQTDDPSTTNEIEGKGRLVIEGKNDQNQSSKKKLFVEFPVTVYTGGSTSLAGIIANDMTLLQSDAITGTIICTDPNNCQITCASGNTTPTQDELSAALGVSSSNSEIEHPDGTSDTELIVAASTIPDVPPVPTGQTVNNIDLFLTGSDVSGSNVTITLPRPPIPGVFAGDQASTVDVNGDSATVYYYYSSQGIGGTKLRDLVIDSTITPRPEIRIYTDGDIDLSGNQDLRMDDDDVLPSTGQIRIYGAQTDGTLPSSSQNITISGTSCITALIHAPKGIVDMVGGGNGCDDIDAVDDVACNIGTNTDVNIYGLVWVDQYLIGATNSNSYGFCEDTAALAMVEAEGVALNFQGVKLPTSFNSLRWGEFE